MGSTYIKRLENRSSSPITLLNKENSNTRGNGIVVPPNSHITVDMAIPWAPAQIDFAGHHLEITVGGVTRYWIWQAANADGDFIRFSTDGAWHDQGEHAHGYAGVATNLFEALPGFFNNDAEPLAQLFLAERTIVVLDSHFETVPIAPKIQSLPPEFSLPPVTIIKQIENRTGSTVTIFSEESNQMVTAGPGAVVPLDMTVPWVHLLNPFQAHHLKIALAGVTRFWIWQQDQKDGDYIRFSTNGLWSEPAPRVKGFDGTGICPADLVFTRDRNLIVTSTGFELMPHPLLLDGLLDFANRLIKRAKRVEEFPMLPAPASVPKRSAVAFSMPGLASDAFSQGRRDARFLYKDSGKRYEFTLGADGKVTAIHPDGTRTLLDKAFSYKRLRRGEAITPPPFDLIAANGARVFAKAKDADDFYFLTMDEHYIYKSKGALESDLESTVPSSYFKIDPEFGHNLDTTDLLLTTHNATSDHPASERFPMFRKVLQKQPTDMMIAILKPREWQQLDCRPPQNVVPNAAGALVQDISPLVSAILTRAPGLASLLLTAHLLWLANKQTLEEKLSAEELENWSAPPPLPEGVPTYTPVTYERPDGSRFRPPVIKFQRVLDIGISHVHHHQQYQRTTGGEIQPMLDVDFYKAVYRFFNGPIRDGDGYIDGTSNLYALVRHDLPTPKYSLLFQDEQLYFSQRWRIVGPDDTKGLLFSLASDLAQPEYQWDPSTYWDPFKSGHINDNSRLAVAAHVVLVTGKDPVANAWRIYSTNFSWGTMDRTWRWRKLPENTTAELFSDAAVAAGDETIPPATRQNIYPQTIRLRDDVTMHLKGTRDIGGQWTVGHWYQRYLPADNNPVPPKSELVAGQMPSAFYEHKWKFLPERTFRLADKFHTMGVYDEVDSRTQYYDVTPATAIDAQRLEANAGPWIDDTKQLYVSQWKFRWHGTRLPGADPLDTPSLFNLDTRLRIVRKGSRWIAMFADKRDDDMMPFERLPRLVTLKRKTETGAVIETVQVTIGANHFLMDPPVVQNAYFWLEPNGTAGVAFESRGASPDSLRENIFRVRMASLEADSLDPKRVGRINQFLDKTAEGNFTLVGPGMFEFRWTPTAAELALLQQHATPNGEMQFGTSIWFEDVAGNVAPPEQLVWHRSATAKGTATPAMIPLGVPTQVTIRAIDLRTGIALSGGIVTIDGQQVGTTDAPFTFTFNTRFEEEWIRDVNPPILVRTPINPQIWVQVPSYPEVQVPVTYFTPSLSVRMEPSAVPIGPATQVIVRAEDATTRTPVNGRVFIAGMDVGATNQPFTFAFGPSHFTGGVTAAGYPSKSFLTGIYTPEMQVSVSPSPIWTGRPVEVIVRAVDKRTGAPINGRVKLNGVDVAATNTPFMFTFGFTPPIGVVSAPFYADTGIIWPPLSRSTMWTSITPLPPMNRTVQTTISAVNQQTGAPVAGRVKINGTDVGPTNTVITAIFKTKLVGAEMELVGPEVVVTADGYTTAEVDIGF